MIELLENNEVILLMYLADELPPVDRAEVAQMLAGDASLRSELERLREMCGGFEVRLAALDGVEPISSQAIVVRRVGRAIRQRLALQAAEAARKAKPVRSRLILPWWAYPSIAAAAIFLAFITWVMNYRVEDHPLAVLPITPAQVATSNPTTSPVFATDPDADSNGIALAQDLERSFGPSTDREDNQMFALSEDPQIATGSDKNE